MLQASTLEVFSTSACSYGMNYWLQFKMIFLGHPWLRIWLSTRASLTIPYRLIRTLSTSALKGPTTKLPSGVFAYNQTFSHLNHIAMVGLSWVEMLILAIKWFSGPPAAAYSDLLVKCGCKVGDCTIKKCGCFRAFLPCTTRCGYCKCSNIKYVNIEPITLASSSCEHDERDTDVSSDDGVSDVSGDEWDRLHMGCDWEWRWWQVL